MYNSGSGRTPSSQDPLLQGRTRENRITYYQYKPAGAVASWSSGAWAGIAPGEKKSPGRTYQKSHRKDDQKL